MKRITKKDVKTISSFAKIAKEITKNKNKENIDWDKIEKVLRTSFENRWDESKTIKVSIFGSLQEVENFLYDLDFPSTTLSKPKTENYRYYGIGQTKEGETKEFLFDAIDDNPMVINRPFTIVRYGNGVVDVVHMNRDTIHLSKEEYEIYKELFAD